MKKFLSILILSCLICSSVVAEDCAGGNGEIVRGNSSGVFCKSKVLMNFWSAMTWCQKIGSQLVEWNTVCPGLQVGPNKICNNLKGVFTPEGGGNAWVYVNENYKTNGQSYRVNLVDGQTGVVDRNRGTTNKPVTDIYAFCEE